MRIINYLLYCFIILLVISCKKKKDDTPAPTPHTVTLQPGGSDGQDSYVSKIDNTPADGNANLDWVNEIVMGRWQAASNPNNFTARSYLKFTGLNAIPTNANVTSAKLYLYGKSSSMSFPNGNSSYPGSVNPDNTSLVQRVTGGNWDESTLTWNIMPAATDVGEATIPASTTKFGYGAVVDVTTIVKQMVAQPTTNYGFMIKLATETPSRSLIFATSENSDPNLRPKLIVEATY